MPFADDDSAFKFINEQKLEKVLLKIPKDRFHADLDELSRAINQVTEDRIKFFESGIITIENMTALEALKLYLYYLTSNVEDVDSIVFYKDTKKTNKYLVSPSPEVDIVAVNGKAVPVDKIFKHITSKGYDTFELFDKGGRTVVPEFDKLRKILLADPSLFDYEREIPRDDRIPSDFTNDVKEKEEIIKTINSKKLETHYIIDYDFTVDAEFYKGIFKNLHKGMIYVEDNIVYKYENQKDKQTEFEHDIKSNYVYLQKIDDKDKAKEKVGLSRELKKFERAQEALPEIRKGFTLEKLLPQMSSQEVFQTLLNRTENVEIDRNGKVSSMDVFEYIANEIISKDDKYSSVNDAINNILILAKSKKTN